MSPRSTLQTSSGRVGRFTSRRPPAAGAQGGPGCPAASERLLQVRVRVADGRHAVVELPAERHRALHLGLLHQGTEQLIELAGGRRTAGGLRIQRKPADRSNPGGARFLPGGTHPGVRDGAWLETALGHVADMDRAGLEVFVGPAGRARATGSKAAVECSRHLWVDIDNPGELWRLWRYCEARPPHLVVSTAGSGGVHVYWALVEPLPARTINTDTGEVVEWVERANRRLVHALAGDRQSTDRSRLLRVAGTTNYKTGQQARIAHVDFHRPPYKVEDLVGGLPDPPSTGGGLRMTGQPSRADADDGYRAVTPPDYFRAIAGIEVPAHGFVSCPMPDHEDRHPSCKVWPSAQQGWHCFSCGVGGSIYDLAAAVEGGPTGAGLRGEDFKRAQARLVEAYGER